MLTIHRPITITAPEQPFDTALFDVAITSRVRSGNLEPVLRVSLRPARKVNDRWEVVGDPVIRTYPSVDALLADLPEAARAYVPQVWEGLEAIVQAIIDKHELL